MRQSSAEELVVSAVGTDDVITVNSNDDVILAILSRLTMATNLFHAIGVVDRDVVGTDADDRAVFLVKFEHPMMALTGEYHADVENFGQRPMTGTGELADGSDEELVEEARESVDA